MKDFSWAIIANMVILVGVSVAALAVHFGGQERAPAILWWIWLWSMVFAAVANTYVKNFEWFWTFVLVGFAVGVPALGKLYGWPETNMPNPLVLLAVSAAALWLRNRQIKPHAPSTP